MTNQQRAAIEEAAKLPTAEETLKRHVPPALYKRGDCYVGHALDAIESHTSAHTTALQKRVKELKAQNERVKKLLDRYSNYFMLTLDGAPPEDTARELKLL